MPLKSLKLAAQCAFYATFASLVGCVTTNPVTAQKRLLGVIPVPFSGNKEPVATDSPQALMIEQLEPLIYTAIPLIIGGAIIWKVTSGWTGLGQTFVILGFVFIGIATFVPQVMGWVAIVTGIAFAVMVGYLLWMLMKRK